MAELADAATEVPQDEEAQPPPRSAPQPVSQPLAEAAKVADTLPPPPPPPQPHTETLPEGWCAEKDPASGDTFYVNLATDETTWVKPTGPIHVPPKPAAKAVAMRGSFVQQIETQLTHKHAYGWKRSLEEVVGEMVHMDTDEELAEIRTMRHSLHEFLEGTWYAYSRVGIVYGARSPFAPHLIAEMRPPAVYKVSLSSWLS
eukprot:COSAG02_NODE_1834_length_10718_cov_3.893775_2_plen_201_part_00